MSLKYEPSSEPLHMQAEELGEFFLAQMIQEQDDNNKTLVAEVASNPHPRHIIYIYIYIYIYMIQEQDDNNKTLVAEVASNPNPKQSLENIFI